MIIAIVVMIVWQYPFLGSIRYPFIILGTWFHEMGHGLSSLMLGGKFFYLEIYENGGGVAYTQQSTTGFIPYRIQSALVAAGGLLGPSIFGGMLIVAAAHVQSAVWGLRILVTILVASILIWVRSLTGVVFLSLVAVVLIFISIQNRSRLAQWTLLFLGIECTLSTYLQLGYVFTYSFERFGAVQLSDTGAIAQNLFGPFWFWAILIMFLNIWILWRSYGYYLRIKYS